MQTASGDARYILSVDVEDYFQVEAFAASVSRAEWENWPSRVVANTERLLDLCDEYGAKATYFTLGWVAHRFPELVRKIAERGHELACHSFWHRPVFRLTPQEFREDLRMARNAIEQASGARVTGYRAPSWSITKASMWALDILAEEGFVYDSSIYPIVHDLYGVPGASPYPSVLETKAGTLLEFPPATVRIWGGTLPCAGGGYLRIFPFWFTQWSMRRLAGEDGRAVVVYLHPWEVDPEQPRMTGPLKSRFRHYTNLRKTEPRLRELMSRHKFQPFRDVVTR